MNKPFRMYFFLYIKAIYCLEIGESGLKLITTNSNIGSYRYNRVF